MKLLKFVLIISILIFPMILNPESFAASEKTGKKKVIYRSYTQLDFSGQTVQGKVRAPEVFYIFQRKRSQGHHVVEPPALLPYHRDGATEALKGALPK